MHCHKLVITRDHDGSHEIRALTEAQSNNNTGVVRYYDTWFPKPPSNWKEELLLPWIELER